MKDIREAGVTVFISESEKHPIEGPIVVEGDGKKSLFIFGLKKTRGDKSIYSTKFNDALYDVIAKHNLIAYVGDREMKEVHAVQKNDYLMRGGGTCRLEVVGIAYDIRKTMSPEKYLELLAEIARAVYGIGVQPGSADTKKVLSEITVEEKKAEGQN